MVFCLQKINAGTAYAVNEAMLLRDTPRPAARQYILEWLWFADTGKGISEHRFN
jgi:hypothetical protein